MMTTKFHFDCRSLAPLYEQYISISLGQKKMITMSRLFGQKVAFFLRLFLVSIFLLGLFVSKCDGHSSRRLPLAGIFGIGGDKKEQQTQQQQQQQHSSFPPPPQQGRVQGDSRGFGRPPPPRPPQNKEVKISPQRPPPPPPPRAQKQATENQTSAETEKPMASLESIEVEPEEKKEKTDGDPQLPGASQWDEVPAVDPYQQMQQPAMAQGWMAPPPPMEQGGWAPSYYEGYDNGDPMYIQGELEQSLARESDLISQLDNLTAAIVMTEQREELHIRQLDVLTERIMDIEAKSAEYRNALTEYEANCTALALASATLQDEVDEWQKRCADLSECSEKDQEKLSELKRLIKEKESEAEEIAIAIENVRLSEKRREASLSRRKAKKKSLLGWFLGFFISEKDDYEEMTREDAYDMAKSTLLRALNSERSNVHELEAIVTSLQQNNSAISEMVESRDTIIDELNNRIAVFEEDKVVLKAALRQLQKEIKEEAPKAQKLMDDLAKAENTVKGLNGEMNALIKTHQEELNILQKTLSSKQKTISESESNLTAIGTYVDKLEDRLTSFAITRRDMEERERQCKEIEEAAAVGRAEKKELEEKLASQETEQDELKKLLEDLVSERANLQKDNRKLATDSEFRIAEQEQLQAKCTSLECEVKELSEALTDLREKCDVLTPALEAAEQSNMELQESANSAVELENQLEVVRSYNSNLQEELRLLKEENDELAEQLDEIEQSKMTPPIVSRDVPLRSLRKKISKATGIHGLITPASSKVGEKASESNDRRRQPDPDSEHESDDFSDQMPPPGPPPLPSS